MDSEAESPAGIHRLRRHGVVFYAHPRHHRFPWAVADNVANSSIQMKIFRLAFRLQASQTSACWSVETVDWAIGYDTDSWQRPGAHQSPSQVWDHAHGLTEYQVWTCYRVATKQLNLYHENRHLDNSCRADPRCHGVKETAAHIFWECPKSRACLGKLIGH